MSTFEKLAKHPTFTMNDAVDYCQNLETARSAVKRLMAKGRVMKIKNNLYTCVSPEHNGPVASRYQIASAITPTSYVSHHSAMEYYGYTNQVTYEVIISSTSRFSDFEFDGYDYRFTRSHLSEGIVAPPFSGGVKVTDLERSLIDCIKDMNRFSGLFEIMEIIEALPRMSEEKLWHYMDLYDNRYLYQKVGYLLWPRRERLCLSDDFFSRCENMIGKSKRYLTSAKNNVKFISRWNLIVPAGLNMFGLDEMTDEAI